MIRTNALNKQYVLGHLFYYNHWCIKLTVHICITKQHEMRNICKGNNVFML